jgi:hypothetical protein
MASKSQSIVGWAAAGAVLVVLSGSATDSLAAKKRPAHHAQQHKAAAPAANELETQAMAFESFMRHGREIDADFKSSSQVSRDLQTGAGHDAEKLQADMIAYAAMAALQEPSFVEGLRAAQAQNSDLVARISTNPDAVLQLPGAGAAAGRASAALQRQGEDLAKTGARVQQASYSVQQASWS